MFAPHVRSCGHRRAHIRSTFIVHAIIMKAHIVMLVMVPEMPALHQIKLFAQQLESSQPDVRANLVLNRVHMPSEVPVDAIRRHLKMPIAAEIPDDPGLIAASVNRGVPFVTSHPRSAAASPSSGWPRSWCQRWELATLRRCKR